MRAKISTDELPPCQSGPQAAADFENAMRTILSVPKAEIERREKAWRKRRSKRKATR